jgi:calcium permeable stress-gated cation channel
MMINDSYGPLLYALPLTLADKTYGGPAEHHDAGMASSAPAPAPAPIVAHDSTKEKQTASATSSGGPTPKPKIEETPYFAVPPGDQEQNPEAARQHREEQEFGFAHPAASRPQRCIWLPEDQLGLFKEEVKMNKEMGVDAEAMNAVMNEKGSVDISGPPPDEIQEE